MLPREHRLCRAEEFRQVSRSRARSRGPLLSVTARPAGGLGRVGFVVPRPVGTAVVRNRVRRRLRHLVRARLQTLAGFDVVVRVNPPAASASHHQLVAALDRALTVSVAHAARQAPTLGATS